MLEWPKWTVLLSGLYLGLTPRTRSWLAMGAWGIGLYSGDFALDLRTSVKAVAHLPFPPDELLDLLRSIELAADDAADPDHTVFWLVVADQFAKRGIDCAGARNRSLAIIADGSDLATMARLGMDEKSLAKRRGMLDELGQRLRAPPARTKARAVLKVPQALLLRQGEVLAYPVSAGKPINPYAVGKGFDWVKEWKQDGWGALAVAECGLMFGFLAWYRPFVITEALSREPTLTDLTQPRTWLLRNPGTLTKRHHGNLQLKSLGRVAIDAAKLEAVSPKRGSPASAVVSDISLANNMNIRGVGPHEAHRIKQGHPPTPRINALADIAAAA